MSRNQCVFAFLLDNDRVRILSVSVSKPVYPKWANSTTRTGILTCGQAVLPFMSADSEKIENAWSQVNTKLGIMVKMSSNHLS